MTRAFVKESDGFEADDNPPELRISEHRNLVTARGLSLIEAEVRRLESELAEARSVDDVTTVARLARDLRYWTARRRSAEVIPAAAENSIVRFGTAVTLQRNDGTEITYRIVGEDEAAPADGRISYVSPFAKALLGRTPGDIVDFGGSAAEIVRLSNGNSLP